MLDFHRLFYSANIQLQSSKMTLENTLTFIAAFTVKIYWLFILTAVKEK
jgi:hypothetical protein